MPHDSDTPPDATVGPSTDNGQSVDFDGPSLRDLAREAASIARSQPVPSLISVLIFAAVCTVVLATTGQAAATERRVIDRLDATGSRTLVVSDPSGSAGLTARHFDTVENLDGIEWAIALGPPQDMTNTSLAQSGAPVAVRSIYSALPPSVTQTAGRAPTTGETILGSQAQKTGGYAEPIGALTRDQDVHPVVGAFTAQPPLSSLNNIALTMGEHGANQPVQTIVIIARTVEDITALQATVPNLLNVNNSADLQVASPTILADLQAVVSGEVGRNTRRLMLLVLVTGLALVAVTQYGSMASRRRDFGRRRALGATRSDLLIVLVAQTLACAVLGVALGSLVGSALVLTLAGSLPAASFVGGIATLVILSAVAAALPPAATASRIDPVRILRVP